MSSSFLTFSNVCKVEGFVGGIVTVGLEIYIWKVLSLKNRAIVYYHLWPIACGASLVVASVHDTLTTQFISLLLTACTVSNAYNTFFVHVVASQSLYEPMEEWSHDAIFLPRMKQSGARRAKLVQLFYCVVTIAHLCLRSAYVSFLLS